MLRQIKRFHYIISALILCVILVALMPVQMLTYQASCEDSSWPVVMPHCDPVTGHLSYNQTRTLPYMIAIKDFTSQNDSNVAPSINSQNVLRNSTIAIALSIILGATLFFATSNRVTSKKS